MRLRAMAKSAPAGKSSHSSLPSNFFFASNINKKISFLCNYLIAAWKLKCYSLNTRAVAQYISVQFPAWRLNKDVFCRDRRGLNFTSLFISTHIFRESI